ncbi:hypothetical protein [Croceicoccus bisphenolivorans]|uniref:hypothetical protein n=1 Tax=Croceicoccus bisphenolivorans TaxID=1783232 RepID=UPI00083241EE|nr:hypothetical protein [Croceicoccus bisphenolivorans]
MRIALAATPIFLMAVAGCSGGDEPAAEATEVATPVASPASTRTPFELPSFDGTVPGPRDKDPQALLDYWKGAVEAGDEDAAAKAWFDGDAPSEFGGIGMATVRIEYGEPQVEGAAGSSYLTVPFTATATGPDGEALPRSGTITARRVNDVDGASDEQLSWRIVSLEWS